MAIQKLFVGYLGIIEGIFLRRNLIRSVLVLEVYIAREARDEVTLFVPVRVCQIMAE